MAGRKLKRLPPPPAKGPQIRPVRFPSLYYYNRTQVIWKWMVASLPLDLALLWFNLGGLHPQFLVESLTPLVWLSATVALLFIVREPIIDLVFTADRTRSKLFELSSKHSWVLLAIVALVIFGETTVKAGGISVLSVAAAIVITIGAARSLKESLKQIREKADLHKADAASWIEEANRKVFLSSLIPIIAARAFSVLGLLQHVAVGEKVLAGFLWPAGSLTLLLLMEPLQEHFMITCKRCGQRTSRVLKFKGMCPWCEAISPEVPKKESGIIKTGPDAGPASEKQAPKLLGKILGKIEEKKASPRLPYPEKPKKWDR